MMIGRRLRIAALLIGIGTSAFGLGSAEASGCRRETGPFTAPSRTAQEPVLRFLALGDTGRGGKRQRAVAAPLAEFNAGFSAQLVLMLGDNFYPRGVRSTEDRQWSAKFEQMYDPSRLDLPFYVVLGNHDYRGDELAEIAYSRRFPKSRWEMPGRYYTFSRRLADGTEIAFFALDTNTIQHDSAQLSWLNSALASSTARWKIVFGHHVLYSYGYYGDDGRRIAVMEKLLVHWSVDLYLSGHEHQLQILRPISGVSYMTSGAGSRPRRAECGEMTVYAAGVPGFLAFEVSKNRLVTYVILADGTIDFTYKIHR